MKNGKIDYMTLGRSATRRMYSDRGYKETRNWLLSLWKAEAGREGKLRLARLLRFVEELRDAE
jgi:hypothetical protein